MQFIRLYTKSAIVVLAKANETKWEKRKQMGNIQIIFQEEESNLLGQVIC